ncbi:MAG TPA: disulfide bond formation protein B, partial [Pseudohaliea sp.]|nr:disulfide bond formation protein B [Pseudohaliea sp.]
LAWQYLGGVEPCILCIYQRWPYVAVAALAAAGLVLDRRPAARAAIIALCGVALLIGAGIAGFHVGVEQHWWAGTADCFADPLAAGSSIDALRAQLLAEPVVPCDEVTWSLFGISMAGYNFLISLGLGITALAVARVLLKETGR